MDYAKLIAEIGLPEKEAAVYGALISLGEAGAKELLPLLSGIKRANLYALLGSLKEKGLISESEKPGKMRFRPETPEKLRDFVSTRLNRAKEAESAFERSLPLLISQFNLASGKPTIRFFEGREAVRRILEDSLTAEQEILQYIDSDAVEAYFSDDDAAYRKKRIALGIKKRFISTESASLRKDADLLSAVLTEARIIPKAEQPLATSLMIYDGRISYLTLSPAHMIGVIIADSSIYETHRALFETLWNKAEPLTPSASSVEPPQTAPTQPPSPTSDNAK